MMWMCRPVDRTIRRPFFCGLSYSVATDRSAARFAGQFQRDAEELSHHE